MDYNFDEIIDRKDTDSIKHDFYGVNGIPDDAISLWVADMDFRTPAPVIDALVKSGKHGVFGYTETREDYFLTLQKWFTENYDWQIHSSWLVKTPGVVFAIAMTVRALTNKGDAVMIQRPVYFPFSKVILDNKRILVNNPLIYNSGTYSMDFEDFETKIIENGVKLFILCNPHNPVGRVWTRDELIRLGDICIKHGVTVISDEIHADFIYSGYRHQVFANIKPEFGKITVTCTAPSKTFNLAGLQVSNIIISNRELKEAIKNEISRTGHGQLNTMGIVACKAAYEHGHEWLQQLKAYLAGNLSFVRNFLAERLPKIKLVEPQGTYLVWMDFTELGLTEKELEKLIVSDARLWLDSGTMFGDEGKGFQRINIACPRVILEKAFLQLEAAVNRL
ncbi:MalY/PatB family protein [Ruminiclostridium cellulolyticum]|uniref:cysteine-S-conjugate beta-lyase n=1 Tax=Ruminiclostridium cellulolyticum (strain ATCC 35319 / DSM 5812 / JCM 6584 / H10) TaxID=394503 RepID=B8I0E9_RUMCH|nr:MalY/PatB family protein [Ruminiclostridium cellulolyticum]ACL77475.1 aminotransferase class I and II [Ruminiclostridium cellulolyticum H10]